VAVFNRLISIINATSEQTAPQYGNGSDDQQGVDFAKSAPRKELPVFWPECPDKLVFG
jgi:hypothetical protein